MHCAMGVRCSASFPLCAPGTSNAHLDMNTLQLPVHSFHCLLSFTHCSLIVHPLFTLCSLIVHPSFTHCSLIVHNLTRTRGVPIDIPIITEIVNRRIILSEVVSVALGNVRREKFYDPTISVKITSKPHEDWRDVESV